LFITADQLLAPPDRPPFLAVWLLIIADNIMHVVINATAIAAL
jgi:hypothetical protein